jgi:hypothetical protein
MLFATCPARSSSGSFLQARQSYMVECLDLDPRCALYDFGPGVVLKGSWHDCSLISCLFVTFGYFWRVNTNCSDSSFSVWIRFAALTQWLSSLTSKLRYLLVCRNTTFAHRFSLIYPRCQLQGILDLASYRARLKCSIKQCIFRKHRLPQVIEFQCQRNGMIWNEVYKNHPAMEKTTNPASARCIIISIYFIIFQYVLIFWYISCKQWHNTLNNWTTTPSLGFWGTPCMESFTCLHFSKREM